MTRIIKNKDELKVKITTSVKTRIKHRFSVHYLYSAALFTRNSYIIEKKFAENKNPDLYSEDIAYVTGAIFSSVAFLESTINELFSDACDTNVKNYPIISKLDPTTILRIKNIQDAINVEKSQILDKYQLFLMIADKNLLDFGSYPCQDAGLLIKLRNDLVHFKPEWIAMDDGHPHKPRSGPRKFTLKGKFDENIMRKNTGNPFYPDKCLGHGCAEWAVNTSKDFINMFYKHLNIEPWPDFSGSLYNTR